MSIAWCVSFGASRRRRPQAPPGEPAACYLRPPARGLRGLPLPAMPLPDCPLPPGAVPPAGEACVPEAPVMLLPAVPMPLEPRRSFIEPPPEPPAPLAPAPWGALTPCACVVPPCCEPLPAAPPTGPKLPPVVLSGTPLFWPWPPLRLARQLLNSSENFL